MDFEEILTELYIAEAVDIKERILESYWPLLLEHIPTEKQMAATLLCGAYACNDISYEIFRSTLRKLRG